MKKISSKNKIIIVILAWLLVSAAMFVYFFTIMDSSNQQKLDSMADDRKNLVTLTAENESFKKAQADLTKMAAQPLQPENFFSTDVTFVKEIQTLEDLAIKYNQDMHLGGVSGTVKTQPPAGTATPLVTVGFNVNLTGSLSGAVDFIESMENLNFVTSVKALSMSSGSDNQVQTNISANFYLKK